MDDVAQIRAMDPNGIKSVLDKWFSKLEDVKE